MACRILLDENMMPDVADILQSSGHDVVTVHSAGLRSSPDHEILSFAASQGRVLVTGDLRDFVRLARQWNAEGRIFPGIVQLALRAPTSPFVVAQRIERHVFPDTARLENSVTWPPPVSAGRE